MALFQKTLEQKYLKHLDAKLIDEKYLEFNAYFGNADIQENIRNSKEEQYQGEFLIDLFVKILGYVKNPTPNFNLTTEYKNIKDSKKADGAIIINECVKAVIELKGTNTTDLSKIETQAFGYKNNQSGCVYVVPHVKLAKFILSIFRFRKQTKSKPPSLRNMRQNVPN